MNTLFDELCMIGYLQLYYMSTLILGTNDDFYTWEHKLWYKDSTMQWRTLHMPR